MPTPIRGPSFVPPKSASLFKFYHARPSFRTPVDLLEPELLLLEKEDSEAPFSSDGMVTFAQAIREGKMDKCTDDFKKLSGDDPLTVRYMFEHTDDFQIGVRHSKDA